MPRQQLMAAHGMTEQQVGTIEAAGVSPLGLLTLLISLGTHAPKLAAMIRALLDSLKNPASPVVNSESTAAALLRHDFSTEQIEQLAGTGFNLASLLAILNEFTTYAPQIVQIVKKLLAAFQQSPAPVPPAPVP